MVVTRTNVRAALVTAAAAASIAGSAAAATWNQTAKATYNWFVDANWTDPAAAPNGADAVALLTNNIADTNTLNLDHAVALGSLSIGDSDGSHDFKIQGSNTLTFQGSAASLTLGSVLKRAATISAPVSLASDLKIDMAGTDASNFHTLTFDTNTFDMGTAVLPSARKTLTVVNGVASQNSLNFSGQLAGNGIIINNSKSSIIITGTKSFTGTFILNTGIGGSNTGSLTLTGGSIKDAAEVIINGVLTSSAAQLGGSMHAGSSSGQSVNPGQRFTSNIITLNGGTLSPGGQLPNTTTGGVALWSDAVVDNVARLNLNSGTSLISMGASTLTAGTRLNITASGGQGVLNRERGATVFVRSSLLASSGATSARLLADNATSLLVGDGSGAAGSATMKVVPWMAANDTSAGTSLPLGLATYVAGLGFRPLSLANEYSTDVNAGSAYNINVNPGATFSITGTTATINSFRHSGSGAGNIGTGKTLTVKSGGIYFSTGIGGIGGAGSATAGTLDFGSAEGVIWSVATNTNTIGAVITGTGGLTKASTGTLLLAGANAYRGKTVVGAGVLQVGNGTQASKLGTWQIGDSSDNADVIVDAGAILDIRRLTGSTTIDAIDDHAALRLETFGSFNGKINIDGGAETVKYLYAKGAWQAPGTYTAADFGGTFITGGGSLVVTSAIPEPTAVSIVALGALTLLPRRRSR